MCYEILDGKDSVSKNISCSVLINAEKITSTNFDDQKIRYKMDFCILHTVLLGLVLLFLIAAIFCHYTKHSAKCIGKLTI